MCLSLRFTCFALSVLLPVSSRAQLSPAGRSIVAPVTNAISGTVVDPSGAKIAGAAVHAENNVLQRDAVTDNTGHFSLDLPAGTYRFDITSAGFEPFARLNLVIGAKPLRPLSVSLPVAARDEIINVDANGPGDNGGAIVFDPRQLNTLSDNDATLQQQLLALAGGDGLHAPQIYVDGFSGGRFPPKSSIRQIRINLNPVSAQYDAYGSGRIEILTKSGTDKLHGFFQTQGNNRSFNSRNPFTGAQPPYYQLYLDGDLSGSLGNKTSIFGAGTYNDQQNNAVVNAVTLGPTNTLTPYSAAVPNPQKVNTYSARVDRQLSSTNDATVRYEYNQVLATNAGIGLLVLPSEGTNNSTTFQTLQLSDVQISNPRTINEARFQYIRTRLQQLPVSTAPSLVVQGSFFGGGSPLQFSEDNQDRYELQDYLTLDRGKHLLRFGGRYRLLRDSNVSLANYNGQYTFSDIAAFQSTQRGLAAGLTPAQIRAAGGGATQLSLTAGQPSAVILTGDIGLYADDEWKLTRDFTLTLGFRFESQSALPDHSDPSPRIGLAYNVHPRNRPSWFTLRSGYALFYQRFDATNLLTSVRQNGTTQQVYFVNNPDIYPAIPAPSALPTAQPTLYRVDPHLRTAYDSLATVSLERIGKYGSIVAVYFLDYGDHQYLSINANAPLPGTYNPAIPTSGTRPFGGSQNIYQFSSGGVSRSSALTISGRFQPARRLNVWGVYYNQHANADVGVGQAAATASSFASNSYNIAADYARGAFAITHRLTAGGSLTLFQGITLSSLLRATSGMPFNITTGFDNNGDTIYNDRPSFATDLTRASVVRTRLGNFDLDPLPSQRIIPANYGIGPDFVALQLSIDKSFKVGPRSTLRPSAAGAAPGKSDPPYELGFSVEADNVLNHTNPATPIGVLTSPFFGRSISIQDNAGNSNAANRTVTLRSYFRF